MKHVPADPGRRYPYYIAQPRERRMQGWTNIETSMVPPPGQRVPASAEQIGAAFLTDCLRHAGAIEAQVRVAEVSHERIGQGAGFAGRIARLTLRYDPEDARGPRTLIAKFATDHAPTREMLGDFAGYAREVRFYRELAPRMGIDVPRCYFAHYARDQGEFLLLLEDLAPARTVDLEQGLTLSQAEHVLDRLAHMHARFWGRVDDLSWLELTPELIAAVRERFLRALPGFLSRMGPQYPALARAARLVAVLMQGDEIMAQARRPPLTVAHNDVHVNNLLFTDGSAGRFALIDWQSLTLSRHGTSDVARVLGVCISEELRRSHGRALLRHYHERLRAYGVRGFGRLQLTSRLLQETAAMVIVSVMAFDTLDFTGEQNERTADLMAGRIEAAVADVRVVMMLRAFVAGVRLRRLLLGACGERRPGRA